MLMLMLVPMPMLRPRLRLRPANGCKCAYLFLLSCRRLVTWSFLPVFVVHVRIG